MNTKTNTNTNGNGMPKFDTTHYSGNENQNDGMPVHCTDGPLFPKVKQEKANVPPKKSSHGPDHAYFSGC